MDRLACLDLPFFPLQLLLREHPDWAGQPAAVVEADKPQGLVLWVNARARAAGVLPGQRYGAALSLAPGLRAGTVPDSAIARGVAFVHARLHDFSPEVEPSAHEPGVFWLDADGLAPLFGSEEAWALAVREALGARGLTAAVVVGFRRFGTYAIAKALGGRKVLACETPEAEDALARRVPLSLLGLAPSVRDTLERLGLERVADFLGLPAHGVLRRFGPEAHALHRFASGELDLPLNPLPLERPLEVSLTLDYRETNLERLVFLLKPLIDQLLFGLSERGQALVELGLQLVLEDAPARQEIIRTAAPTLASPIVMELVKLRLHAAANAAPVIGLAARATGVPASAEQLAIFAELPRRDLAAAARAFARLRAAFGSEDVVAKAALRERHLPEVAFGWEPLKTLRPPHPRLVGRGMLVRRLLSEPVPLAARPAETQSRWWLRGPAHGPVEQLIGPYRLTGGWWRREIERDYYFAELAHGELWWIFYDRLKRRWFLQGEIS